MSLLAGSRRPLPQGLGRDRREDGAGYRSIRRTAGYRAQADHAEMGALFRLLDAKIANSLQLTESFAIYPTAAVFRLYCAHLKSRDFGIGRIEAVLGYPRPNPESRPAERQ